MNSAIDSSAERSAFVAAIADAWDDPAPVQVFADWLEERGEDATFLRWYAGHVLPAEARARRLAADPSWMPDYEGRGGDPIWYAARQRIFDHRTTVALFRFATLALCRRERTWETIPEGARSLLRLYRLFSLGLAGGDEVREALARERRIQREDSDRLYGRHSTIDPIAFLDEDAAWHGRTLATGAVDLGETRDGRLFAHYLDEERDFIRHELALFVALAEIPPASRDGSPRRLKDV